MAYLLIAEGKSLQEMITVLHAERGNIKEIVSLSTAEGIRSKEMLFFLISFIMRWVCAWGKYRVKEKHFNIKWNGIAALVFFSKRIDKVLLHIG